MRAKVIRKKWKLSIVLGALALTLYHVLPTVFYYSHGVDSPIDARKASYVARSITGRLRHEAQFSDEWAKSFVKLLPASAKVTHEITSPNEICFKFKEIEQARIFAYQATLAGASYPFEPMRLGVKDVELTPDGAKVTLFRHAGQELSVGREGEFFGFCPKIEDGQIAENFSQIMLDRLVHTANLMVNASLQSAYAQIANQNVETQTISLEAAKNIIDVNENFSHMPFASRFYGSFSVGSSSGSAELLISSFDHQISQVSKRIEKLKREKATNAKERIQKLQDKITLFKQAKAIVQSKKSAFETSKPLLAADQLLKSVVKDKGQLVLDLGNQDPFIKSLRLPIDKATLIFELHRDVQEEILRGTSASHLIEAKLRAHLTHLAKETGEPIQQKGMQCISVVGGGHKLSGFLTLDLRSIAQGKLHKLKAALQDKFQPSSKAFKSLKVETYGAFEAAGKPKDFKGILLGAPVINESMPVTLDRGSLYVIFRGYDDLIRKVQKDPKNEAVKQEAKDLFELQKIIQSGASFYGYSSKEVPLPKEFHGDFFFESPAYYQPLIQAMREPFKVIGSKRFALLELTTYGAYLQNLNRIETLQHEELCQWRDDYRAAQVDLDTNRRMLYPEPVRSTLWNNIKLSARKYFRGDPRKTLKWALDLSGGKSVRISLKDLQGKSVTGEEDLNTAIEELYKRVNRLGVSEVSIRREGEGLRLDFPGAQSLSAKELITGSTMTFHIVNEVFSPSNPQHGQLIDRFLSEVWQEARVMGLTDAKRIHALAYRKLTAPKSAQSQLAKEVVRAGLKLASPDKLLKSSEVNTEYSMIARVAGTSVKEWGASHPLVILFANYALEGSDLKDASASYSTEQGNYLAFSVKNTLEGQKQMTAQNALQSWTTKFAKSSVQKTGLNSGPQIWRMAIVLNDEVISAPRLNEPLRDGGSITGNFSQKEVERLSNDLKAGSLSFRPHILSESNISPELGESERLWGILATCVALFGVIALMVGFYRLGGVVASICVIFNLMIMWALLQNLGAALSLANLAGVVLTLGMAVDANVLVFERIREEYKKSGKLKSALSAGYKRAFTAIFDSNLTTAVAAFILLNFDSGPVKGFALALVVGIVSSMFTALFVSRFLLTYIVERRDMKQLAMGKLFEKKRFNFFKGSKRFAVFATALVVLGFGALAYESKDILGMDFTGGYSFQVKLDPRGAVGRDAFSEALQKGGISPSSFQVREEGSPDQLRVMLSTQLDRTKGLFAKVDSAEEKAMVLSAIILKGGIQVAPEDAELMKQTWVEMSGQLSDMMRKQAVLGLLLALGAILIYISYRFDAAGAFSAIVCLVHDVTVTLGALAILRVLGIDLKIDLHIVAALLTIVGYSLNDTIIIFDRLREERLLYPKEPLKALVSRALNATLARTTMTSATTLIVLVALVILGGKALFTFSLVMLLGVFFGTLSSLFLAGPLLLGFTRILSGKKRKQAEV
jgi:SecD/SecF fusion protein